MVTRMMMVMVEMMMTRMVMMLAPWKVLDHSVFLFHTFSSLDTTGLRA